MSCQRIYVGGLAPDVKDADVLARFKPFGKVASCEIVRGKDHSGDPAACRGFAYVTLSPKDEAALARVFSLYNGCKWRGQKLRVEVAKPHYSIKLQQEWQQQRQQQQEQEAQAAQAQQNLLAPVVAAASYGVTATEDGSLTTLRITVPGTRKSVSVDLTSKTKSYKNWFASHKEKRISELDWEPLRPSKRIALQAAADAVSYQPPSLTAAVSNRRQQQQQQRHQGGSSAAGAAVPYHYKEQQQQPAIKGVVKQLDHEHFSQLKLLKKIAEQDHAAQQQQQQYDAVTTKAGAGKSSSKAEIQPGKPDQQQQVSQQQQGRHAGQLGVVVFSDDEDDFGLLPAAAIAAAAAGGDPTAGHLSRFADDSGDDDDAYQAAPADKHKRQQVQGKHRDTADHGRVAAPPTTTTTTAAAAPAAVGRKQSAQQIQRPATRPSFAAESGVVDKRHSDNRKILLNENLEEHALSSSPAAVQQQQLQQCRGARLQGRRAQLCERQHLPESASAQQQAQQQQQQRSSKGKQQQGVIGFPSHVREQGRAAAAFHGGLESDSEETLTDLTSEEPVHQETLCDPLLQQQQQQQQGTLKQTQPQDPRMVLQQQQQQPSQQVAVVDFLDNDGEIEAAAAFLDGRFSSDSEETLRDADSEDEAVTPGSAAKQQQQQRKSVVGRYHNSYGGRELLCPLVPSAGAVAKVTQGGLQRRKLPQKQRSRAKV